MSQSHQDQIYPNKLFGNYDRFLPQLDVYKRQVSDGVLETGDELVSAEIELYGDKNARELAEYLCREA